MAGGTRLKFATCNVFSFYFFFFQSISITNIKFLSTYVFCFYSIHFFFNDRIGGHVPRVVFYVLQIRSHSCLNAKICVRTKRKKRKIILDLLFSNYFEKWKIKWKYDERTFSIFLMSSSIFLLCFACFALFLCISLSRLLTFSLCFLPPSWKSILGLLSAIQHLQKSQNLRPWDFQ